MTQVNEFRTADLGEAARLCRELATVDQFLADTIWPQFGAEPPQQLLTQALEAEVTAFEFEAELTRRSRGWAA